MLAWVTRGRSRTPATRRDQMPPRRALGSARVASVRTETAARAEGGRALSTRLRVAAAGRCETDDGTRRLCAQIFCMGRAVLCTGYVWWPLASRPAGPRTRWSLVGRKPGMDKISSGRE